MELKGFQGAAVTKNWIINWSWEKVKVQLLSWRRNLLPCCSQKITVQLCLPSVISDPITPSFSAESGHEEIYFSSIALYDSILQETKWNILLVELFLNLKPLSLASTATDAVSLLFMKANGEWNMTCDYNENIYYWFWLKFVKCCVTQNSKGSATCCSLLGSMKCLGSITTAPSVQIWLGKSTACYTHLSSPMFPVYYLTTTIN